MTEKTKTIFTRAKPYLILAVVLIIIIMLTFSLINYIDYLRKGASQYHVSTSEFNKYKTSFQTVAQKVLECYSNEKNKNDISVATIESCSEDGWTLVFSYANKNSAQSSYKVKYDIDSETIKAYKKMLELLSAYHNKGEFNYVTVRDNMVEFSSGWQEHAIMYSADGKKALLDYYSQKTSYKYEIVFIDKLAPKLYQVIFEWKAEE